MDGVWPRDYAVVTNPTPPGFSHAAQYTVSPSSVVSGEAGQRALDELWPSRTPATGKTRAYQGADSWYRDELYLPSSFQPVANEDWNFVYEIHNWPDAGSDANLSCAIVTTTGSYGPWADGNSSGERLSCRILGGGSAAHPAENYTSATWPQNPDVRWAWFTGLNPAPRNQWVDMAFHIKWSSQSDGLFEWWVNGVKKASWSGPTLLYYQNNGLGASGPGQGYLTHGYYRPATATSTASLYHAATMDGPTAASIGENLP
jgi:hypothetical protein